MGLGSGIFACATPLGEPQEAMAVLDHFPAVPSHAIKDRAHRAPIIGCFVSTWHATMEVTPITCVTASGEDGDA